MRNKSCGNGSKNCVAFRNVMRNGIAIGNPSYNFHVKNNVKYVIVILKRKKTT